MSLRVLSTAAGENKAQVSHLDRVANHQARDSRRSDGPDVRSLVSYNYSGFIFGESLMLGRRLGLFRG